jgi:hypothetical protein
LLFSSSEGAATKKICLMKKECSAPLRWGACNESSTSPDSRGYSCRGGIDSHSPPSLDPYVPANDRPRKAAGLGARLRNSCALRASVSMLTPHSSWPVGRLTHCCSTIDQIIDEAALASQGRLSKNGAIIDQSTDPFRQKANVIGVCAEMCHRKIRRNAVPVEEFSRGGDVLRHKRDADAGTIQSARGVGFFSGVIGLGRELDADLVAWAEQQVTLRLSARIDADRLVAEIEQLV